MLITMIVMLRLESLSDDETHVFLLVLYQLVPQLSITAARSAAADIDDSDSDDDEMDVDGQVHFIAVLSH